jgi:predicted transcriptional regulator
MRTTGAFPITLPVVGSIFAVAVTLAGAASIFVVKGIRSALEASQETVKTLLDARAVAKEALLEERARWELKVDALQTQVKALEEQVAGLRGQIVADLLETAKEALSAQKKAKSAARRRRAGSARRA